MKKLLYLLPILALSMLFACAPGKALAAYDPNLIITDAQLTAKDAMSEQQIQDFLAAKGSFLANFTVPAPRTVTYYINSTDTLTTYENTVIGPYGVSSEVDVQGWRASKVIWQVSQWYGVNPQVVLTIIEKESSFILGRTSGRADGSIAVPGANSYATYAWMMGYSYTESGATNSCGTATPVNPTKSCAGIAAQLDNGTWALANWKYLAENRSAGNSGYGCDVNYDGHNEWTGYYWANYNTRLCEDVWITPGNGSTAALYRYTPHTGLVGGYAGNRAFYLIYTNWFDLGSYVHNNLLITSSLTLSNPTPAIGERITASYGITNTSASPVTLSYLGVTNRLGGFYGSGADLGWLQNVTIAAGATQPVSVSEILTTPGTYYYWAAYVLNGTMYYALPQTNQVTSGTFYAHVPNIAVITPLAVNPKYPIAGQSANYTITFLNHEPSRIYFADIGIMGVKLEDMTAKDISWTSNSYIEPGGFMPISVNVALPSAHYSEWPALHIGSGFYNIYLDVAGAKVNVLNLEVPGIEYASKVTSSLTLSNPTPAIGERITASYGITNTSASPVTLSYLGVTNRLGGFYGSGADLGWLQNVTIAAGATQPVSVSEILTTPGTYYYWAAYVLNGTMYYALPQTNQVTSGTFYAHVPNIAVITPLAVNPKYPIAGQSANYAVTVRNNEPNRIYYSDIGIMGVRLEDMVRSDLAWASNSFIEPGANLMVSSDQTLPSAHFSAWPAMHFGNGFYNVYLNVSGAQLNILNFEVPGTEYASKITVSVVLSNQNPAVGELVSASYQITNTSASPVTLSYLGVTNRLGGFYGSGADLGWLQNVTIAAGATQPVSVSEILTTPGTYYYWAAYVLNGTMYYALPQTSQVTSGTFYAHL